MKKNKISNSTFPSSPLSLCVWMTFHWNSNLCASLPLAVATKLNYKSFTHPFSKSQQFKFQLFRAKSEFLIHLTGAVTIIQWAANDHCTVQHPIYTWYLYSNTDEGEYWIYPKMQAQNIKRKKKYKKVKTHKKAVPGHF